MNDTTFLYVLTDPITGAVRYLGKSDNPFKRLKGHLQDSSPSHKKNWIYSLKAVGQTPHMDLLDEVPTLQWGFWEREYIRVFRAIGMDLVNSTDGGEGGSGHVFTPEQCAAQSASWTPERRAALSAVKKGVPLSPEVRMTMRGPKSPEHSAVLRTRCAVNSASQKGIPSPPEHCAARRVPKSPRSPEHCAAISKNQEGFCRGNFQSLRKYPCFSDGGGI